MGRKDKHRTAVKSLSLKVGDLKQVKERVPLTAAQKEEIGRLVRAGVPKVQLVREYPCMRYRACMLSMRV